VLKAGVWQKEVSFLRIALQNLFQGSFLSRKGLLLINMEMYFLQISPITGSGNMEQTEVYLFLWKMPDVQTDYILIKKEIYWLVQMKIMNYGPSALRENVLFL